MEESSPTMPSTHPSRESSLYSFAFVLANITWLLQPPTNHGIYLAPTDGYAASRGGESFITPVISY